MEKRMEKKYYIAYGSNLNKFQMKFRCPTAAVVGTALLSDYQLTFSIFATIEPKEGACVPVAVWEIDDQCEQMLDTYEDYPRLYRKEFIDIEVNGRTINAMVYLINRSVPAMPDEGYVRCLTEGYEDMDFDVEYLRQALVCTQNKIDNR